MKRLNTRLIAVATASLLLAAQAGCGRARDWTLPPPPSEDVRSRLGRVVVRTDDDLLAESALLPMISGACGASAFGSVTGLLMGLVVGGQFTFAIVPFSAGGGPFAPLLFALFFVVGVGFTAAASTLGALGGCLWGLSKAPSGKQIEEGRRTIEKALRQSGWSRRMGASVVELAARETDTPVVAWSPGIAADTLLEISGPCVTLRGSWKFDAPLRLHSEVQVRLRSARSGALLHTFSVGHVGSERMFEEWAESEGAPVVEDLGDPGLFAQRIVEELFLLDVRPPVEPPSARRTAP